MRVDVRIAALLAAGLAPSIASAQSRARAAPSPPTWSRPPPRVQTVSLLTVGDSVGGYRLAELSDGMGAYERGSTVRRFGLLVDHELQPTAGALHAQGQTGAFVSL